MVAPDAVSEYQLEAHPVIPKGKPFLLVVLDGWSENKEDEFNAIYNAECPTIKSLKEGAPRRWRTIKVHGTAVGLPSDADMGNNKVGHNAMGAGKIIQQGASLVDDALEDRSMLSGAGWNYAKELDGRFTSLGFSATEACILGRTSFLP